MHMLRLMGVNQWLIDEPPEMLEIEGLHNIDEGQKLKEMEKMFYWFTELKFELKCIISMNSASVSSNLDTTGDLW